MITVSRSGPPLQTTAGTVNDRLYDRPAWCRLRNSGRSQTALQYLLARCRLRQVLFRLRLAFERSNLVRVVSDHQIVDVVVDLCEPVACTGWDDDYISGLQFIRHTIPNIRPVITRPVELDNGPLRRWAPLSVRDIRSQDERGRAGNDVIHLADQIMLSDRISLWLIQLHAVNHSNADVSLTQLNISHLLI